MVYSEGMTKKMEQHQDLITMAERHVAQWWKELMRLSAL